MLATRHLQFLLTRWHDSVQLPAISSWYSNALTTGRNSDGDSSSGDDGYDIDYESDTDDRINDAAELQELMDQIECGEIPLSRMQEDTLTRLMCAAMAITSDKMAKV